MFDLDETTDRCEGHSLHSLVGPLPARSDALVAAALAPRGTVGYHAGDGEGHRRNRYDLVDDELERTGRLVATSS